jgi:hypothetical protein
MAVTHKRAILLAIKAVVSLALLGFVVRSILAEQGLGTLEDRVTSIHVGWLAVAVAVQLLAIGLGIVRWKLLLTARSIHMGFGWLARSYFVGRFIGAFTPSTTGLDVYRAVDVGRATGDGPGSAAVIAIEKCVGLLGLALACLALLPLGAGQFFGAATYAMAGAFAGAALVGLWLLAKRGRLSPVVRLAPKRLQKRLTAIVDALGIEGLSASVLARAIGLGLGAHLATAAVFSGAALALGVPVAWTAVLIVGNAIVLATLLPVSIGGVGVREGVAVAMLTTIGVTAADATLIALLGYLVGQVPALAGGLLMLAPSRRPRASDEPTERADDGARHEQEEQRAGGEKGRAERERLELRPAVR